MLYEGFLRLFAYRLLAFGITVSPYTPLDVDARAADAVADAAASMLFGPFSSQILRKTSELEKSMRLARLLLAAFSRKADSLLHEYDDGIFTAELSPRLKVPQHVREAGQVRGKSMRMRGCNVGT